jgi:hypothetical protein
MADHSGIFYVLTSKTITDAPRYFRATIAKEHVSTVLFRNAARFKTLALAQAHPAVTSGAYIIQARK